VKKDKQEKIKLNEKEENIKSIFIFSLIFGIILIIGIISNLIFNNDTYTFKLIFSEIIRIIIIALTVLSIYYLMKIILGKNIKNRFMINEFLIVLLVLCSISYDFNLTSTILYLILISFNLLTVTTQFTDKL
jgi:hypothetical protein